MGLFDKIGNKVVSNLGFGPNRYQAYQPTLLNVKEPTGPSNTWMEQAKLFDQQLSTGQDKARQMLGGIGASGADMMSMFGTDAGSVARLGGQMGRAGEMAAQELAGQNMLSKQESLANDLADQTNWFRQAQLQDNQLQNQAGIFNRTGQDNYAAGQSAKRGAIAGAAGGLFGGPLGAAASKLLFS